MEDTIKAIMEKLSTKKMTIEAGMYAGGCAAVPTYTVTIDHNGEELSKKSIELEEALEDILDELD